MDNNYYIYLKVEDYLKEWLENHFGTPVILPKDSPENRFIIRMLQHKNEADAPDLGDGCNVAIRIPWSKEKDPRRYNYFSDIAKNSLENALHSLFIQNMWTELMDIRNPNMNITDAIYAWLDLHGINPCHWETIRQKYYRLRDKYRRQGVRV